MRRGGRRHNSGAVLPDCGVKGLRVVGNASVDLAWKDGKLVEYAIHADSEYNGTLVYGEKKWTVHIGANEVFQIK